MTQISAEGRAKLTEPWEECVLYVYDDKIPKRRINGRLQYPEWDGGVVRGTLTVGWGHTDEAGGLQIKHGLRLTQQEADDLLSDDLEPCDRAVTKAIKVPVSQHRIDGLVDLTFNCPSALPHVAAQINAGDDGAAEHIMLQYVYSKGERMEGLIHRRTAEIAWMNTPDDPEEAAAKVFSSRAEREPQPQTMVGSTTGAAAIASAGGGGIIVTNALSALQQVNDAAAPIEEAKQHLDNLGLLGQVASLTHSPALLLGVGIGIIVFGVFIWLDRRHNLTAFHV